MKRITVISHWGTLIENLQTSSLDFYNAVELAIKRREIPEAQSSRVEYHEGGLVSDKRQYLKVERKNLTFEICAAPFGTGFFVSSWFGKAVPRWGLLILLGVLVACLLSCPIFQGIFGFWIGAFLWIIFIPCLLLFLGYMISEGNIDVEETLLETPILGFLYDKIFHPMAYYKYDTIQMYQEAVHAAVIEVIDDITKAQGLRALTELERKPVIKDFLGK